MDFVEGLIKLLFLAPEFGDCAPYLLLKDFDEFFVLVDDFLLGLDFGYDLLLLTDSYATS